MGQRMLGPNRQQPIEMLLRPIQISQHHVALADGVVNLDLIRPKRKAPLQLGQRLDGLIPTHQNAADDLMSHPRFRIDRQSAAWARSNASSNCSRPS